MDLSDIAVPQTLIHLRQLLPPPPARIVEVGCGRGALAAALSELGYTVTGVDQNCEMAAATAKRGVSAIHADIKDVSGQYDIVLFTRSLHHAKNLDDILAHAVTLLSPGGQIIVEEFAWERVNSAAAGFLYENRALLVSTGLLEADRPSGDLLEAWVAGHHSLQSGAAMLTALNRISPAVHTIQTSILWRLVDGRGGVWTEAGEQASAALTAMRAAEERQIATGTLPAVGLLASIRP